MRTRVAMITAGLCLAGFAGTSGYLNAGAAPLQTASAGTSSSSFDNPSGLCAAIPSLPSDGWRKVDSNWQCSSSADDKRKVRNGLYFAWSYRYEVTGFSGQSAQTVRLLFENAGEAGTWVPKEKGLPVLASYAQTLSRNTGFHLSGARIDDIRRGKPFSFAEGDAEIKFEELADIGSKFILTITRIKRPSGVASGDAAAASVPEVGSLPASVRSEMTMAEEACRENGTQNAFQDCKCVARTFAGERMKGDPSQPWQAVFDSKPVADSCPNGPGIVQYVHTTCTGYYKGRRPDYDAFCTCVANDVARAYVKKPLANMRYRQTLQTDAMNRCGMRPSR